MKVCYECSGCHNGEKRKGKGRPKLLCRLYQRPAVLVRRCEYKDKIRGQYDPEYAYPTGRKRKGNDE